MSGNEPATTPSSHALKASLEGNRLDLLCLFALQHKVTGGDSASGVLGCLTTCSERGLQGPRGGSPEGGSPEGGSPEGGLQRAGPQRGVSRGQVSRVGSPEGRSQEGGPQRASLQRAGPQRAVSRGGAGSLHRAARSSHGPSRYVLPEGGAQLPSVDVPSPPLLPFQQKLGRKTGSPKEQASNSRGSGSAGKTTES